jgi:hypothetical protein
VLAKQALVSLEPHLQSILAVAILKTGSHELFAQAGLES